MSEFILQTRDLTRTYKQQIAVDQLNLHIPKNSIYGLLGRNGAGKTTTLRMLMGLVKPSSGDIEIFGQKLQTHTKRTLSRIGSLIEMPGFYQNLTAQENLEILARLRGIHRRDAITYALEKVGLHNEPSKIVSQYSLGMKQRLGIAAAIMHEPELLILDEPINGLDPIGIHEMRHFLESLRKEHDVTILISSHILSEIEQLADMVGIIHKGRLLEEITIEELREKNRQYIELEVSNPNLAALLLEQHLQISDYLVHENNRLRIYSNLEQRAQINKLFVSHGLDVSHLLLNKEGLEDYFVNLIGGGTIG